MTESLNNNRYVAHYQAILAQEADKVVRLDELNEEEEANYLNEFPEVSYDIIFGNKNPDDFLEDIIKSDQEFYQKIIALKKKTLGNYYVACYQNVLGKRIDETKKLINMSYEKKKNYFNEFPEIEYESIFADNDPVDVLAELLKIEDGFLEYTYDLLNPLASDETVAKRNELFEEMKQYPLIKYCPNPYLDEAKIESIASKTYSKIFNYSEFKFSIEQLISKPAILKECFIAVTVDVNDSLTIALVDEEITNINPTISNDSGGYFNKVTNQLVITNTGGRINLPFMAHELAHKLMNLLFNNNSDPYPKDDVEIKFKYHQAIKEVLLNIKDFIKNEFGIDVKLKEDETTWKIGKKLAAILFPHEIKGDEEYIEYLVEIFQENNLNINQSVIWLGNSMLEQAVYCLKFELADLMIKNGFELDHNILILAVNGGHKQIIDWYLQQEDIDLNFRNKLGDSALEGSNNPEITKLLISAGAEVYSARYFEQICSLNENFVEMKEMSPLLKNNLKAIKLFLVQYLQYDQNEEDCEFIVRLPQVMAEGLYKGKVIDILAPMSKYWEDVVSPKVTELQNTHKIDDAICLPIYGYCKIVDFSALE